MRLPFRPLLALCALLALPATAASPPAPEIWMGALEPPWREARGLPANDYLDLFHDNAPWPEVAAHLGEVELTKRFVMEAPEDMLAAVAADLGRRHIRIAMQISALVATKECGSGVEGYGPKDDARRAAERLRRAGGELDAVVMDGPVWFGHLSPGRPDHPACQMPVADAAKQALAKIAQVRAVFPGVRVGQIEPFGEGVKLHDVNEALVEWFANLALLSGRPVTFLQADIAWQRPDLPEAVQSLAAFARTQRVAFGIIYGGGRGDLPDAAWSAATRRHYQQVEGTLGIAPDIAAFVTATPRPGRMLPENAGDTLTGTVLGYMRFRSIVK